MQLNENHDEKDQKTTERTGENRTQYRLDWNLAGGHPRGSEALSVAIEPTSIPYICRPTRSNQLT